MYVIDVKIYDFHSTFSILEVIKKSKNFYIVSIKDDIKSL